MKVFKELSIKKMKKMEKVLLFIDTSGSTFGNSYYYNNVNEVYLNQSDKNVILYEWARDCLSIDKESFGSVIKTQKCHACDAGGTSTSTIIPFLDQDLSDSKIIIITDGHIKEEESINTCVLLTELKSKKINFPKIELKIFNTCDGKVDDSVILPFTIQGNIDIEVDKSKYVSIESFERTIESITEFIKQIDIPLIAVDIEYKNKIHSQLRAMTFLSNDKGYILAANKAINKLKLSYIKNKYLDKLSDFLLKNKDINEIIEYLKEQHASKAGALEQEASRLNQIVDGYRDTKTLIFNKNVIKAQPAPEIENENDVSNIKSGFIECPITIDRGVPYLVCNRQIRPIFNECKKDILKQICLNPLLINKYFYDTIESLFGSYFCFDPCQVAWVDPLTRSEFLDEDSTVLVLTLGTSEEQINYTNSILFRLFSNDSKICDPDFIFMSIWYHLKYNTKKDYLKELIPAFEAQLKQRFEKKSFLSLNTNTYENLNKAEKFACVWFILHELPYLNQTDQAHSSVLKYLSTIEIMFAFLQDVFNISVSSDVKAYLKK